MFFEDFALGQRIRLGTFTMDRDEIVDFGRRYDPQPFHVDEVAARQTPFGGLVASGWHTVARTMRVMVESMTDDAAGSLGSPGVDTIRWLEPVRPGDTLTVRGTVREARVSRSKPDRGLVTLAVEVENQEGVMAMTMSALGFFRRRAVGR